MSSTGVERSNKKRKITSIMDFDKIVSHNKKMKEETKDEIELQSAVLEV